MADLRIKVKVDGNTGELLVTKKNVNALGKSLQKAESYTDRFNKRVALMAHSAAGVYGVKQAFDAVYGSAKALVDTASQFEKFDTVLTTIEGSSQKAEKSMGWITTFAKDTPYEVDKITDSFVKLKSYGIDPIDGTINTLGDTASAMGKDLNQAVEAMADAVVGENERLKEFGLRAAQQGDKVAYSWTTASGKAKHIIVDNNSEVIQSTLSSIFNSKYEGAMQAQSKTFAGMVSNMSDNWTIFKKELMDDGAFDYVKALVKTVGDQFNAFYKNTLDNTDVFTQGLIGAVNGTIIGVGKLANAFEGIAIAGSVAWDVLVAGWHAFTGTITSGVALLIDGLNKLPFIDIDNTWSKAVGSRAWDGFDARIESINGAFDDLTDYEALARNLVEETNKTFIEIGETIASPTKKGSVKNAMDGTFGGFAKTTKTSAKEVESIMDNLSSSMSDTFERNFFDSITGKFTDFKSFLKTTFSDLGNDILNPFAKQISSSFLGKSAAFATVSTGSLIDQGFTKDSKTGNYIGGTDNQIVVDSGGQVIQGVSQLAGNSELSSALNYASGLKSAYGLATTGLSASVYGGFTSASSALMSSGLISGSTAAGIDAFGFGMANPFTSFAGVESSALTYGQALGGAALGAMGGYIVGSLGDKLFGVDTKASSYGAIGGAIGSLGGPIGIIIGSLLGSAIGGMFGKTKQVGSGLNLQSSAGFGDVADIQGYSSFEKNSWFNDKSWTNVHELSSSDKAQINSIFGTFEFLLDSLTDNKDVIVQAGMYSGTQLIDTALPKAFLQSMTGLSNIPATIGDSALDKVFDSWSEYAISFDKTVTEALTESVGSFITAQSSWKRTIAQIDGEDILSFDIDVAKKGLKNQIAIYSSSLRDVEGLQSALENLDFKAFTELSSELIDHNYFKPENLEIVTALGNELGKLASLEAQLVEQLKDEEKQLEAQKQADADTLKTYVTAVNKNFDSLLDPDTLYIDGSKWVEIGEAASWAFKVGEDGIRSTAKTIEETLINNPKLDESGDILNSTTTFLNAAITSLNNFKNALGTLSKSVQSSIDSLTSKTFKYSDIKNISGNLAHSTNDTFIADATGMQNDILNWYQGTTELKGIYDGLSVNNKSYTKKDLDNQLAVVKSGKDIKKEINTFNSMLSSYKSTLDEQTNIVANIESVTNSLHDSVVSMSLDDSISYLSHQDRAGIALSEYKTAFAGLQGAMSSGNSDDTSLYLSRVVENSKAYLTNLKEYSDSSKYQFEFARISHQLKGVNGLEKAQKTQEELTAETNRYMSDIQEAILLHDPAIAKSTKELAQIAKDELLALQNLINQKSFDPTINVSPVIYVNGVQTSASVQSNNVTSTPSSSTAYSGPSYSDLVAGKTSDDLTPAFASQLRVAALAENNTAGYAIVEEWLSNEGFKSGGYTGYGNSNTLAGSVHKDEYVINSRQLNDPINRDILARLEAQRKGQKSNSLNIAPSKKEQDLQEQNELLKEQNEMLYAQLTAQKEMLEMFEDWDVNGLPTKAVV